MDLNGHEAGNGGYSQRKPIAHRVSSTRKPNEFGRLVRLDEVENGIVSGYEVVPGNQADTKSWLPALEHHQECFRKAPEMAAADRGFFSAQNEREAEAWG